MARKKGPLSDVRPVLPAYQSIADQLSELILSGKLASGERLPVEDDLATRFGVSRSTIREALRFLAAQNMVVTLRGVAGGTFVVHPQPAQVSEYLESSLGLMAGSRSVTLDDLLEARMLLEVPAARLAASRRTEAQLEAIHTGLASSDDVGKRHLYDGNRSFHVAILEAAGNQMLTVVTGPIFGVLRTRILRDLAPQSFWDNVARAHHDIAGTIAAQEPDAAEAAMRTHLEHMRDTYLEIYDGGTE